MAHLTRRKIYSAYVAVGKTARMPGHGGGVCFEEWWEHYGLDKGSQPPIHIAREEAQIILGGYVACDIFRERPGIDVSDFDIQAEWVSLSDSDPESDYNALDTLLRGITGDQTYNLNRHAGGDISAEELHALPYIQEEQRLVDETWILLSKQANWQAVSALAETLLTRQEEISGEETTAIIQGAMSSEPSQLPGDT